MSAKRRNALWQAVLTMFFLIGGVSLDVYAKGDNHGAILIIQSNVKNVAIMVGENVVGTNAQPIAFPAGIHIFQVNAKGYVSRTLRVNGDAKGEQTVTINLQKAPPASEKATIAFILPPPPSNAKVNDVLPSVCALRSGDADFSCSRKVLDDDITFSGLYWFDPLRLRNIDGAIIRRVKTETLEEIAKDQNGYHDVEVLWGIYPGHEGINALLARLAMLRGDCVRINDLLLESQRAELPLAEMNLLSALCYERVGAKEVGLSLLEKNFEQIDKYPAAYFHRIRRLLPDYGADAQKLLNGCLHEFPAYYPCYELWSMLENLHKQSSNRVMRLYVKANQVEQSTKLAQIMRLNHEGKAAEALAATYQELNRHHLSFEFTWFRTILETKLGQKPNIAVLADKAKYLKILNKQQASGIIDEMDGMKQIELEQLAYRSFVREYPKEFTYWMKLIKLYDAQGDCDLVMAVARESYNFLPSQTAIKAKLWEGRCLVKVGRLPEAIELYRKICEDNPANYIGYYNLAAVYERSGDFKNALDYFKKAAGKRPPSDKLQDILKKIEYFNNKVKNATD